MCFILSDAVLCSVWVRCGCCPWCWTSLEEPLGHNHSFLLCCNSSWFTLLPDHFDTSSICWKVWLFIPEPPPPSQWVVFWFYRDYLKLSITLSQTLVIQPQCHQQQQPLRYDSKPSHNLWLKRKKEGKFKIEPTRNFFIFIQIAICDNLYPAICKSCNFCLSDQIFTGW